MNDNTRRRTESGMILAAMLLSSLTSKQGRNNMFKDVRTINSDLDTLANDVEALINATANAAEDTVVRARKRLSQLIRDGENAYERLEHSAVQTVHQANAAVHSHPYRALGVALGVGVALGALINRRER